MWWAEVGQGLERSGKVGNPLQTVLRLVFVSLLSSSAQASALPPGSNTIPRTASQSSSTASGSQENVFAAFDEPQQTQSKVCVCVCVRACVCVCMYNAVVLSTLCFTDRGTFAGCTCSNGNSSS